MNRLALALALVAVALALAPACSGSSAGGPAHPAPGGALERPTGPQPLHKGETHEVEIAAGEQHEWRIDLAAGEPISLAMAAVSTGATMCTNWQWGFFNPAGGSLREQIEGPNEAGSWADSVDSEAVASIVEGPTAGTYLVRVVADVACPRLHYTLTAR